MYIQDVFFYQISSSVLLKMNVLSVNPEVTCFELFSCEVAALLSSCLTAWSQR